MAKKDQDLSLTIGFEADKESLNATLDDIKKEIKKEQKKGKATVKVSASVDDNTSPSRVIPGMSRIKNQKKHDALSFILGEAGGTWERFSTAADYHAGTFSPVQTRNRGYIKEIEIPDPTDDKGKKKIKQKELTAGGLVKHTNAVTDAVNAQIKRENSYARQYNLDTIKQAEREDILAAAMLHDRFKYTETGRINPNAMNDAAAWARIGGLDGAFNILSDPNSRGARIISAIDFATSQESRSGDMDENGRWNKDMKKSKLDVLDAAVKSGEGRWKDPDSAHVVDNFERINEATQEENANLEDWRDNLKGIIGDLGIIALLMKGMKAVMKFDKWAEQTVKTTAEGLPTRSNIGATSTDLYRMRSASGYLNLDSNAIYDSVSALAERQGEFATTGQGLELFYGSVAQGLEPILKNMSNPIEAWNQSMDLFLNELTALKKAGDQQGIDKLLNAVQKFMGDEAKTILSRIIDYNFDSQTTNDIKNIGALYDKSFDNPYAWESERSEALNSELNTLRESIKASYNAIADDWEATFGVKFKNWWNQFLIDFIAWYRDEFEILKDAESPSAAGTSSVDAAVRGVVKNIDKTTPILFTAKDLAEYDASFNGSGRSVNYERISNKKEAEALYKSLPAELQEAVKSFTGAAGLDFNDTFLWNLIMAADKERNTARTGPSKEQINKDRASSFVRKVTAKGNTVNGYLGYWLSSNPEVAKQLGIMNDHVWTEEEYSKVLNAYDSIPEEYKNDNKKYLEWVKSGEYKEWLKERGKNASEYKSGKLKRFPYERPAGTTPYAQDLKKATDFRNALLDKSKYVDLARAFGDRGSFLSILRTHAGDKYEYVRDYLDARFKNNPVLLKRLQDENVTAYENEFAAGVINLVTGEYSQAEVLQGLNTLLDNLSAQYEINVGSEEDTEAVKASAKNSTTAMTNPTINITVNGVDTNNAQEVAYAVSSELKPALAAQTDSVV